MKKSRKSSNSKKLVKRKKTSGARTEAEDIFEAIFNNAMDGILAADIKTKEFHIFNKTICRMLGYSAEEFKNLSVPDIHPSESLPYVLVEFKKQSIGQSLAKDIPMKRKDGSVFYADVNSALIDIRGKKHVVGFFRDVTERKEAKESLEKVLLELDKEKQLLINKHIAFQEAIKEIEIGKDVLKNEIMANVTDIIIPILKRVRLKSEGSRKYIKLLENSIESLVSSFGHKIIEKNLKLTPKEIEISNMVKSGLTTKEISGLLNTSSLTIDKHRRNIRKKLGLSHKDINLTSFLQSL